MSEVYTPDQEALIELAKECKQKGGVTQKEAEILIEWAMEYKIPARAPETHERESVGKEPLIGPIDHIPLKGTLMKKTYDLLRELQDETYCSILDLSINYCTTALLVVKKTVPLESSAEKVLQNMNPFLRKTEETASWPGTRLHGHAGEVNHYRLSQECISVIKGATRKLYDWVQPSLPEDLCLLRSDGSPWLATIAHEKDSFMELDEKEKDELLKALPELRPILRAASERGKA